MAIVYAVKNGNWSDSTVWNTGALPAAADDVYSNNFTVNINGSYTVSSINNGANTGVTAGGYFNALAGSNLTCTSVPGVISSSATAVYQFLDTNPGVTATVSGYVQPSLTASVNNKVCIYINTGGVLYVNGTVSSYGTISVSGYVMYAISVNMGRLVVNGKIQTGGISSNVPSAAIYMNTLAGDVSIIGDVQANTSSIVGYSINNQSVSGSVYVTGNLYGAGYYNNGVYVAATANVSYGAAVYGSRVYVTGNVYGQNYVSLGSDNRLSPNISTIGASPFSVTGNVYGGGQFCTIGSSALNFACIGYGSIVGDIYGGYTSNTGAAYALTGNINHTGTVYASAFAPAIQGTAFTTITTGPIVDHPTGIPAIAGKYAIADATTSVVQSYFRGVAPGTVSKYNTYDSSYYASKIPSTSNVRYGIVYGLSNEKSGTLQVPQPATVLKDVIFDNGTSGTLDIASSVWNSSISSSYTAGSIGERIKTVSTVASTGAQLAAFGS